jgi:hypothetical protein
MGGGHSQNEGSWKRILFKTLGDCTHPGKMGIMLGSSRKLVSLKKECDIFHGKELEFANLCH